MKRELGQGRGAPECSTSTKQAVCRGPILAGPEQSGLLKRRRRGRSGDSVSDMIE